MNKFWILLYIIISSFMSWIPAAYMLGYEIPENKDLIVARGEISHKDFGRRVSTYIVIDNKKILFGCPWEGSCIVWSDENIGKYSGKMVDVKWCWTRTTPFGRQRSIVEMSVGDKQVISRGDSVMRLAAWKENTMLFSVFSLVLLFILCSKEIKWS